MARRGSFGRSGTTQNLSMLVYQLLKDQMGSELNAILDAYKNNMQAGKFASQYNGQNVDGQYVLDYYYDMLSGFPVGSTEYVTLKSQIDTFKEQYQNDIQTLVVNAVNNGTQIDFGLLGSGFTNKGISEVSLADLKGWAESQYARLEETNDQVRIDQLKQTVFAAEFNVANDGIASAVTAKERTYSSYVKWLKGQMQSALDAGFTVESEFYRSIRSQWATAKSKATEFDQQVAKENVTNKLGAAMKGVESAAEKIINAYIENNGAMVGQLNDLWQSVSSSSTPYYDLLKLTGEQKNAENYGAVYESIMASSGIDGLADLFANAAMESNNAITDIINSDLNGLSVADKAELTLLLQQTRASGMSFVAKTGLEFTTGKARGLMDELDLSLRNAGMSFGADASGKLTGVGGHPDAVLAAFTSLAPTLDKIGASSYPWLSDLSRGQISTDFVSDNFAKMDTNGDRKVDFEEMRTAFANGNMTNSEIDAELTTILNNMNTEDIPDSKITPGSLVRALVDAAWARYSLDNGSVAIVTSTGAVQVTDVGAAQAGSQELIPTIINVNGKQSVAYVQPTPILEQTEGNAVGPLSLDRTNGVEISVYHKPGNFSGTENLGRTEAMVILKGNFRDATGAVSKQAFTLTFDQFQRVMQAKGIIIDSSAFNNPTQDNGGQLLLSFDAGTADSNFWTNMFNPKDSENFIGSLKYKDATDTAKFNTPVLSGFDVEASRFNGFINDAGTLRSFITNAISDKSALMTLATEISKNKGKTVVDTDDLLDAMLKKNPGVVTNLSYATIKDAVSKNSDWVTTMRTQFPTVPVATPKIWQGTGHTITASGSGVRPYEVGPGSINITGPVRGTGIPESAVPSGQKPGGSSMLDNVGNFLGEVFKKRPDMVGSSVPGGTGIPKDIKFKPTPTVGVKPATNPFAKSPKPPKPTNPMGKV